MTTITKRITVGAIISLLLVTCLVAGWQLVHQKPSYEGRSLASWTTEFDGFYGPEWQEAEKAVLAIGTNGLPVLIRLLQAEDDPLRRRVNAFLSSQSWLHYQPVTAHNLRKRGLIACSKLGTNARPAIRAITNLLYDPELSRIAAQVLTGFGSEMTPVLTNATSHVDPKIRYGAIAPMALLRDRSVVPTLLHCLHDPDAEVRMFATEVLGVATDDPHVAIPALLESLQDTNAGVRSAAAYRLGHWVGHEEATAAVPLLVKALEDTAQGVSAYTREASLRRHAKETLEKLDPETAAALEENCE